MKAWPGSPFRGWLQARGWSPFPFQEEVWDAFRRGGSGLVHAPTGAGKTLAVLGGPLMEALETPGAGSPPLTLLWITPLRALARDTTTTIEEVVRGVGLDWRVELRTGDTTSGVRARQRKALPTVLVTTPESLSLLLTHPDGAARFGALRCVVVDEWHELLGGKRGVQAELALARLRTWIPGLRTWGLSATLGNPVEAASVLVGVGDRAPHLVAGPAGRPPVVESILPADPTRFPWSGHLGITLLPEVLRRLGEGGTHLVFTNTRYQAEHWFRAILEARPEWAGEVGLHHGSLDREVREEVEEGLRQGTLRAVVCTSTLDLGVDFAPVDRVIQIGSPRGVGRLLQRAGRSGHRPGVDSHIVCVPTHALELAEFGAAREAIAAGRVEARPPLVRPLDVLAQHLVTVALGEGFLEDDLLAEVRTTHAYQGITPAEWRWVMDFVIRGGEALRAYPRYTRVIPGEDGIHRVQSAEVARMHRASVGTITSDMAMEVRYLRGGRVGSVEESFISRLRPGDRFVFGGRTLELVRTREMTAWVRNSPPGPGVIPRWAGGRLPLSSELGEAVLALLGRRGAGAGEGLPAEIRALEPLLALQARWSRIPGPGELLVEQTRSREGYHLFLYPFEGRLVHEGLAALLAWRLTRDAPRSIRVSANDHGLELVSPEPIPLDREGWDRLLSPGLLTEDLLHCMNAAELARRRFREIARVAGLLFPGYPGRGKGTRQLQASGELLFDVLRRYDPGNLLLDQAHREVLEGMLEVRRLEGLLERLAGAERIVMETPRLTPFAFPIWAERMQAEVSSERWIDRVQRMAVRLERAASAGGGRRRRGVQSRVDAGDAVEVEVQKASVAREQTGVVGDLPRMEWEEV